MPNENQPQEFETFQLLFDKDLATSKKPMVPFKSFIAREQSFINQILDYMHAPGKIGFFPHSFLGNAVALLSTKLNEQNVNAKKIYYRFEESKLKKKKSELESIAITLKLVVATSKDGEKIDHIYSFIFTEDIKEHHTEQARVDKFEFTKNEIRSAIEDIKKDNKFSVNTLQEHGNKFILVEVLKNNHTLKMQSSEPKDSDIKSKEVYVYKKDNSLYFKAKNILNSIVEDEILIGKEKGRLNINLSKFITDIKGKDTRGPLKFKIKSFLSKKGYHCKKNSNDPQEPKSDNDDGFAATENNITVRVYRKDVIDKQSTKTFEEITYRLESREIEKLHNNIEKYTYLEDYITKLSELSNSNLSFHLKEIFEKFLYYVQQAHSKLEIDESSYGSGAREANQHAFLAGIFQMDRYRDNVRIFIEQLSGRGLADTILLPLGPNRVPNSIPIVIEHKAGDQDAPSVALGQSEEYAKGLQTNRIRFLTTAKHALCVGINLDYKLDLIKELFEIIEGKKERGILERVTKVKSAAKKIIDSRLKHDNLRHLKDNLYKIIDNYNHDNNKKETREKILGVLTFNSEVVNSGTYEIRPIIEDILNKIEEEKSFNEIQKYIKEQLERTYYSFPGTRYGRDNHCFSRFLLGYSSSINDSKYKKYAFFYDESGTTIETDTRPKKYNTNEPKDKSHAVTTVVFISQKATGKVVIINFIEGEDKAHEQFIKMKLAKDKLEKLSVGSKKIVEMNLFFDITKNVPGYKSFDYIKGFNNENKIVEHNGLNAYIGNYTNFFDGNFSEEVSIPEDFNKEIGQFLSNPATHKNFFKKISEIIFPFRELIKNEYAFQAVLDGIFGAYSDKRPNESIVLTEYQTGLGNRIDMIIHQKGKPIIGLELKIAITSNSEKILETAEKQIKEKYEKTVTYKVLEDIRPESNKAELISVVFVSDASSPENLIKCSDKGTSVPIIHSSTTFIPRGNENYSLVTPGSGGRPKTPRDSDPTNATQSDPKRPRTAGDTEQEPMDTEDQPSPRTGLTQDLAASNIGSPQPSSVSDKPVPCRKLVVMPSK